ncbi:hypothetical protein Tco_1033835, partial [Tanacetum coccineum]
MDEATALKSSKENKPDTRVLPRLVDSINSRGNMSLFHVRIDCRKRYVLKIWTRGRLGIRPVMRFIMSVVIYFSRSSWISIYLVLIAIHGIVFESIYFVLPMKVSAARVIEALTTASTAKVYEVTTVRVSSQVTTASCVV